MRRTITRATQFHVHLQALDDTVEDHFRELFSPGTMTAASIMYRKHLRRRREASSASRNSRDETPFLVIPSGVCRSWWHVQLFAQGRSMVPSATRPGCFPGSSLFLRTGGFYEKSPRDGRVYCAASSPLIAALLLLQAICTLAAWTEHYPTIRLRREDGVR